MIIIHSINNIPIRITTERWSHITRRHPETNNQRDRVIETLSRPEAILEGDWGELQAIRLFPDTPLTTKYLVVIYKEISKDDGFILTAYFTNKPLERRKVIWKR